MGLDQKSSIQDVYPLTPAQQGILFHSLLDRESGVYVCQVSFQLIGQLNREAFHAAWQTLVKRYDALRTAFAWKNLEAPLQVVGIDSEVPINWMVGSDPALFNRAERLSEGDRQRGFDLSAAPLTRVSVIRESEHQHRVIWTYHHLILDGWSLPILMREWIFAYKNALAEIPAPVEPAAPYRDYISWLKERDEESAINYWGNYLQGFTMPSHLVNNHRALDSLTQQPDQTEEQKKSVVIRSTKLTSETTQKLKEIARRERVTMSTLVQGAWACVLSRYTNLDDVVFGLARSGRPPTMQDVDSRVGMFVNTLPLRINVRDQLNVFPWLREIQAEFVNQQSHEFIPLTKVHAASDIPSNLAIFDSVVVFENYPAIAIPAGMEDLAIKNVQVAEQTNYPLSLYAVASEQIELRLLISPHLLSEEEGSQYLSEMIAVLSRMGDCSSGDRVGTLITPILPLQEHIGDSIAPSDLRRIDCLLQDHAQQYPEKVALQFRDESMSYAALVERSDRLAEILKQSGVKRGQPVGIFVGRSFEMVIALLGIIKTGAHFVPLDPTHPKPRIQAIINESGVNVVITQSETSSLIASCNVTLIDIDHRELSKLESSESSSPLPSQAKQSGDPSNSLADTAYLIYTSGTTGHPKGVPITHASLANLLQSIAATVRFEHQHKLLAVTTLAFDIAILELLMPLSVGGTVVIADAETVRDGERIVRILKDLKVDAMQATPATWRMCHAAGLAATLIEAGSTGGVRAFTAICGGEALDVDLANRLLDTGSQVWNVYGPTETTIWSGALRLSKDVLADGHVPIGGPLANTSFHVLDQQQRPLPIGVDGELWIGGVGLSSGYDKKPEATQQQFVELSLPVQIDSDDNVTYEKRRLYRTGDRVKLLPDGNLEFLGRTDNQVKLRGYRIELGEIETVLQSHQDVEEAVVLIENQGNPNARLIAAIVTSSTPGNSMGNLEEALTKLLRDHLPSYMWPAAFVQLDDLPLSPNRKVDRQRTLKDALRALQIRLEQSDNSPSESSEINVLPRTQLEQSLCLIWTELLQIKQVSITDNFFEMGGHSLLLLRAQDLVRERLGYTLPLVDFFRYPTIQSLANHLRDEETHPSANDRTVAIQAGNERLKKMQRQSS